MIHIRQMTPEELTRVEEIDVSESGHLVYYYSEGKIATRREAWHRRPRNTEVWRNYIERWKATLRLAKENGAGQLYVSATPSESAISFYSSQGFVLAKQVHKELYALEPEDIHLIRKLSGADSRA
jgi:ribosomal protein S18 acetylase RimI-like enzyme